MYEIDQDGLTVALNRSRYLKYLRENPKGRNQIDGGLTDGKNGRCALGMCCDLLDRNVVPLGDYAEIAQFLGLDSNQIEQIWKMNDRYGYSFKEIARRLEQTWQHLK